MRCPKCQSLDTQVKDSRPTEDSAAIRRRRVCLSCNFREAKDFETALAELAGEDEPPKASAGRK